MPTKKIADKPGESWRNDNPCRNPEHNPPSHQVFPPGKYEHTCPKCGKVQWFFVNRPTCGVS